MKDRLFATMIPLDVEDASLVERPGPGLAPTAFRIWQAGRNDSDTGPTFFTEESATKLMAEQAARGRRLSLDFDHRSLRGDVPATAGRASGWHSIEVRRDAQGGAELWAVDVEWCVDAKAGLEARPPLWRFFSPAFREDEGGEVVSYTNCALCINPLTHQIPSLAAATQENNMSIKAALMAALAAMTKADATEDEKTAAAKTLGDYLEGVEDEKKPEEKKADEAKPKECADEAPPPPPKDDEKKPEEKKADETKEKTESKAAAKAAVDPSLDRRLAALERTNLLAGRDLPEPIRRWCESQPVEVVRSYLAAQPKQHAERGGKPTQGTEGGGVAQLTGAEKAAMDLAMGMPTANPDKPFERKEDGSFVIRTVKPSEYRAAVAAQKGK